MRFVAHAIRCFVVGIAYADIGFVPLDLRSYYGKSQPREAAAAPRYAGAVSYVGVPPFQ